MDDDKHFLTEARYGALKHHSRFSTTLSGLKRGDCCIVRTDRGVEVGFVTADLIPGPTEVKGEDGTGEILRRFEPADEDRVVEIRKRADGADFEFCLDRIREHELPMRLVYVDIVDGVPVSPVCNAKLRREVRAKTSQTVVTLQVGAFGLGSDPGGAPTVEQIDTDAVTQVEFAGYEESDGGGVDLSKAEVIVSAGRGIGKPENLEIIQGLAKALKGEYGASRPVVDSEWADHSRQVGTTGQTVSPKLYVACGISGAIQHLAGMKKSEFVVAINTDKDAPIGEVADVLVVADLKQFVPALIERLPQ